MVNTMNTTVVFDFGNVLAQIRRRAMGEALAAHSPYDAEEVLSQIFGTDIEIDSETGVYDSRGHFEAIKARIQGEASWDYETFRGEYCQGLSLSEEGVRALELCKEAGKRIFVLSNTSYLHARWLFEQEVLATLPEWHIFSFKVGIMKPDPRIWEYMLRAGNAQAAESIYVDDLEENCRTARKLGFDTILHAPGETDLCAELSARF